MTKKAAYFRFYEELNDFLPAFKRKQDFTYHFSGQPSIKDAVEALGVPHTEVDLILINGQSVSFSHLLREGDRVAVYPMFESLDISTVTHLRLKPLRQPKFILDVHLGKLARYLRLLGIDCLYYNLYDDKQIMQIAQQEQRVILTRDIGLLKNKQVQRGYWLRQTYPKQQVREVLKKFDLKRNINPLSRCIICNGEINLVPKEQIIGYLLPKTVSFYHTFYQCQQCHKVFWQGAHFSKIQTLITELSESS